VRWDDVGWLSSVMTSLSSVLSYISGYMNYLCCHVLVAVWTVWYHTHKEHIWNVCVISRVCLSNLVFMMYIKEYVYTTLVVAMLGKFWVSLKLYDFLSQVEQTLCVYHISEVVYVRLKLWR
jgi:hypothetical protein